MTDIELLVDFYKDVERQGPGSSKETMKALELLGIDKEKEINIADVGCGSGAQTITLAKNTKGKITAIDLFPEFLDRLKEKAKAYSLQNQISTLKQSMDKLIFEENAFDLIWSEGAIYIMGFEEGIREWSRFLKPGGFLAVSEITWFTDTRPKDLENYWLKEYPQIDTVSNKIKLIEKNGYIPYAFFILPDYCWTINYYQPMQDHMEEFLEKHNYNAAAKKIVEDADKEIRLFDKYKDYYGYGFYLAQKK